MWGRRCLSDRPGISLRRATEAATRLVMPQVISPERSRALKCCLIGPTNAGKSTLLNSLINHRVATVSPKIHTTRENTLGYLTDMRTATQVEFIDAPGSLGPDVPSLHREIWDAVSGAELALFVVDGADRQTHGQVVRFLHRLHRELHELEVISGTRPQTALVLNKVDAVKTKPRLLSASRALHDAFAFDWPPFMVSARTGDGVSHLRDWLLNFARPGEWFAAAGVRHAQPPLLRASELIREQIFAFLSKELPYLIEQRNTGWTELSRPEGALRIDQQLLVPKGQKSTLKIVEARLPGIATAARRELRKEFGRVVFLHLSVAFAGPNEMATLAVEREGDPTSDLEI
jgi:GTP-binding protein Era